MSLALYQLSNRNLAIGEVEILKTKPQTLDQYWSTLVFLETLLSSQCYSWRKTPTHCSSCKKAQATYLRSNYFSYVNLFSKLRQRRRSQLDLFSKCYFSAKVGKFCDKKIEKLIYLWRNNFHFLCQNYRYEIQPIIKILNHDLSKIKQRYFKSNLKLQQQS